MNYIKTDMTHEETRLRAQVEKLRAALEACTEGFSRPEGSSLLVRSQVYALLAKLKQGWLLRRKEEG